MTRFILWLIGFSRRTDSARSAIMIDAICKMRNILSVFNDRRWHFFKLYLKGILHSVLFLSNFLRVGRVKNTDRCLGNI